MADTKFLRLFDHNGKWRGNPDRTITVNNKIVDMDDYAKKHGIELPSGPSAPKQPKVKKQINIDVEDKGYGDMEQAQSTGSAEKHGDGDSKSTK